MKKQATLALMLLAFAVSSWAQPTVTLLTFESYTFSDKFDTEYGTGEIGDGFQWGGGLEFGLQETVAVELIYQNLKTTVNYVGFDRPYSGSFGINYVLVGGTKYAPLNDKISGFGTFNMGVGWSNPEDELEVEAVTRFALGGRLGLRIMASDKVSLRIHGQLISPVQWAGGGFYFGSGGSGAGISTGSTIWQFNVGGSLNYRLK